MGEQTRTGRIARRAGSPGLLLGAALIGSFAGATPVTAQIDVTSSLDTTRVTVGDRVRLRVEVEHPSDAVVVWPDSIDAGSFELLEARIEPMRARGGRATSSATFSLAAFELGELDIPPFELSVLYPDGREETLETDRWGVEVVSVGVDESGDIREIRGPLAIPLSTLRVVAWALLLLLVGAGLRALVRKLRAGDGADEGRVAGPPPRPPHEVALEELARLEASPLLERGEVKEYHIRVSEIIRRYLEERFRVGALEMTTWEVLEGLERVGVAGELRSDLKRFLDQCDLVKFAKARPDADASRRVLKLGRELVERSISRSGATPAPSSVGVSSGREEVG